ncbi:MAG: thioester domain-containing protein [Coriobacteriales bacterium]|jgi:hypothetical protein|nr:thioester domain-containing protein [Coriobacteriales bacterium]
MLALLLAVASYAVNPPPRALAADPDTDSYTAVVKYYDNIQMKYIVQHGIDEWWTTTGDIPIGGFTDPSQPGVQLIDQAYCVDATVAFHSSDDTSTTWPAGVTTDTAPGYVVVSPLAVSDSVRANLPSLYWLAVNGFRGERGTTNNNLADIQAAYANLESQYGTQIDETIAIMATKAAIWRYTDPTFALLSTSLTADPENPTPTEHARYQLMIALMRALVNDARTGGPTLTATTLEVVFYDKEAAFTEEYGSYYYGPITATDVVSNAGGSTGTPDNIYLSISGQYASDITFVNAAGPTAVALPEAEAYGSTDKEPYVASGDSFYLKIPADSKALIDAGQPNVNFRYIALHGLGKAADVTYSDTPAIMAYQNPASATGEQSWSYVQAFIGFVNNMQASLYGQGHLFINGSDAAATIDVNKLVLGATDLVDAGSFVLTLEVYDNNLGKWVRVPLIPTDSTADPSGNITGASGLVNASPDGVFSLACDDTAHIYNLPLGNYRISEQTSVDGYTAVHQLDSYDPEPGFEAEAILSPQVAGHNVSFTNTILPKPVVPDTPGTPDDEIPKTDDGAGLPLLLLAVVLAACGGSACVAGMLLRRRRQIND